MFFCSSCGAAFNVDYDDDDVNYTELVTQADRTRMLLQRDVDLMTTGYQLNKEMKDRELYRAQTRATQKAVKTAGKAVGAIFLYMFISMALMIGVFIFVWYRVSQSKDKVLSNKNEAYETIREEVKKDSNFMENMIASGSMYESRFRPDSVTDRSDGQRRTAWMVGIAEIEDVYLMENKKSKEQDLFFVYKIEYQYEDSEDTIEVFDCFIVKNLQLDKDGKLKLDFKGSRYAHFNTWNAFEDKDQLYRECILGKTGFTATKLDVTR
jgi:hypothetical protein